MSSGSWCLTVSQFNGSPGAMDLIEGYTIFVTEQQGRTMSDTINGQFRNAFSVLFGPGGEVYEGVYGNTDPG